MLITRLFPKVNDYLSGKLTLAELEAWIVPLLPTFYSLQPCSALDVVDTIEHGLAEIDAEILTESEFRDQLIDALRGKPIIAQYPEEQADTQSGSSNSSWVTLLGSAPRSSPWSLVHTWS